jgi:hypothetical protein
MRKIEDYKKHADECRAMARRTTVADQRELLLNMAQTWESLATERERETHLRESIQTDSKRS